MIRVNCRLTERQAADLNALADPRITIRNPDPDSTLLAACIAAPQMADAIGILTAAVYSILPGAIVSNGQAVALIPLAHAS